MRTLTCILGSLLALTVGATAARAQDVEPNNRCVSPADAGIATPPLVVSGSLDPEDAERTSDVDYYRFTGEPGAILSAWIQFRRGAILDDQCNVIGRFPSFPVRPLEFAIPANGTFLVAVAESGDFDFAGLGSGFETGPYQFSLQPRMDAVHSVSGQVLDGARGLPLPGAIEPRATVVLQVCQAVNVCAFVGSQATDDQGRFRFEMSAWGDPIPTGELQLTVTASGYTTRRLLGRLAVANEDVDLGAVTLAPTPITFADVRPCSVSVQGGTCTYSAVVRNNGDTRLSGLARSVVTGRQDAIHFEAGASPDTTQVGRIALDIPPGGSQPVRFAFVLPSFLRPGDVMCTSLLVGRDPAPLFGTPLLQTGRRVELFCLTPAGRGLRAISPEEAARAGADAR